MDDPVGQFLEIQTTEVDSGRPLANALFQAKFGSLPPDRGRHFVCLAVNQIGQTQLVSYVHFQPFGDICLGGGACTDSRAIRKLSPQLRAKLQELGGPYQAALTYALNKMAKDFFAVFGHTSDRQATAIDLRVGFRQTGCEHLIIYKTQDLDPVLERALIAKAAAVGSF